MNNLISVDKLIKQAKKEGIEFGKGDPYNRLRYYTKIGWLPHMQRKKDRKGDVKGHYPEWCLERLIQIEKLKESGATNEDISKKINVSDKVQNIKSVITSKETRNQLVRYVSLMLLMLIFASELELITVGKPKSQLREVMNVDVPQQITDSGSAFVPRNQKQLYVKTPLAKRNSKVFITFTQDYSPAARYWVSDIKEYDGFLVELDAPVFNNAEFSWSISN